MEGVWVCGDAGVEYKLTAAGAESYSFEQVSDGGTARGLLSLTQGWYLGELSLQGKCKGHICIKRTGDKLLSHFKPTDQTEWTPGTIAVLKTKVEQASLRKAAAEDDHKQVTEDNVGQDVANKEATAKGKAGEEEAIKRSADVTWTDLSLPKLLEDVANEEAKAKGSARQEEAGKSSTDVTWTDLSRGYLFEAQATEEAPAETRAQEQEQEALTNAAAEEKAQAAKAKEEIRVKEITEEDEVHRKAGALPIACKVASQGSSCASSSQGAGASIAAKLSLRQRRAAARHVSKDTTEKHKPTPEFMSDTSAATRSTSLIDYERKLFEFMHQVNEVYMEHLKKPTPFARYILLGLQSTGKSTIIERMIKFPMNVVAEGTGTRCPLHVTCILDPNCTVPSCELTGCKQCLSEAGADMQMHQIFDCVTRHNREHIRGFSKNPLRLTVRSSDVQNMVFVDLPGIITTKGQGEDTRDDIKQILQEEIKVPNTKLLALLQAEEYSTNAILDFLDGALGDREQWVSKAIFLMTKFDRRIPESQTGAKTNRFMQEFWDNGVKPFMVITPTMQKDALSLSIDEQYKERMDLLRRSDEHERFMFDEWMNVMSRLHREDPKGSGQLNEVFQPFIGFRAAITQMHHLLLQDTQARLPEVVRELKRQLSEIQQELQRLEDMSKFSDPAYVQLSACQVLRHLVDAVEGYMNGDMRVALKLWQEHRTLEEEVDEEDESEWRDKPLNHLSDREQEWREHITVMFEREGGEWPEHVAPNGRFLGGKQYDRALHFFKAVMIDRLPDPQALKPYVATATGTLRDGLKHEDWEHAAGEVIRSSVKNVMDSGINFFVKHVLYIFRRLFRVAMQDMSKGEECSKLFSQLPAGIEAFVETAYDDLVWNLGLEAVKQCHFSMRPFYSTVHPSLLNPKLGTERPGTQLKGSWSFFRQKLSDEGITKLYHFTDERNVESIISGGGLHSWTSLQSQHDRPQGVAVHPGGNEESRSADESKGLSDYVHLSFCRNHPMRSAYEQRSGGKCVLLEVDPKVVMWRDTLFADRNALAANCRIGPGLEDLGHVRFDLVKLPSQTQIPKEHDKPFYQAEVLVKAHIPIQYIEVVEDAFSKIDASERTVFGTGLDSVRSMARPLLSLASDHSKCAMAPVKVGMAVQATSSLRNPLSFLPSERTAMIQEEEIDFILHRCYEYIVSLFEHVMINLEFSFDEFLVQEFKRRLRQHLGAEFVARTKWEDLVERDESAEDRMQQLREQIVGLENALISVRSVSSLGLV